MRDPTPDQLRQLLPETRFRASVLLNALRAAGVPAIIGPLGGRRDSETQRKLVVQGRSKTLNSAHLTGRAFDLDIFGFSRDSIPQDFWRVVGPWAEVNLGLRWGGRWKSPYDPGHFEI